jgi:hypothetical protein
MSTYVFTIEVTAEHVWRVEADTPEGAAGVLARQMGYRGLPGGGDNLSWEVTGLYRDGEAVVPIPEIPGVHRGQHFSGNTLPGKAGAAGGEASRYCRRPADCPSPVGAGIGKEARLAARRKAIPSALPPPN